MTSPHSDQPPPADRPQPADALRPRGRRRAVAGSSFAGRPRADTVGGGPAARGRHGVAVFALTASFALLAGTALAPAGLAAPEHAAPAASGAVRLPGQSLEVESDVAAVVTRDEFTFTTGEQSLIAGGTNHDWAKLVLLDAGWPVTDSNVAVMTRWMRQENGPDDWWNRNNPLNNGYGSGGGSGLGSYDTLATAAAMAAENLRNHSGYVDIRAGFAASAPTAEIEAAIWASPWATSHYGNGSHWSQTPVPVVQAPADAWR